MPAPNNRVICWASFARVHTHTHRYMCVFSKNNTRYMNLINESSGKVTNKYHREVTRFLGVDDAVAP